MSNVITITLPAGDYINVTGNSSLTTISNTTVLNNWNTNSYFSVQPQQIAGFNQMLPCNYYDCRDHSICGYLSPVFGIPGQPNTNITTYYNDASSFFVQWLNTYTSQFLIQQRNKYGTWTTVATVTDNTYGIYYAQGTIPNNPLWAGFTVNWGCVVSAFGSGIYRITVNGCYNNYTQATLNCTIEAWDGILPVIGLFLIGGVSYSVVFAGTYTGYLNYLAALINGTPSTPQYTATVLSGGINITGTNGSLSNGVLVKSDYLDMSNAFKAETYNGLAGPEQVVFDNVTSGTYTSSYLTSNPLNFGVIDYETNSCYTLYYKYTNANTPKQIFQGQISFLVGPNNQAILPNVTSFTVNLDLLINGVSRSTLNLYTGSFDLNEIGIFGDTVPFVFPVTDGVGSHPPPLSPGDVVTLKISGTYNAIGGSINIVLGQPGNTIFGPQIGSSWMNLPQSTVIVSYGSLSGGGEAIPSCSCALASNPYLLNKWNCDLARGTVKFESYITGTGSDAYNAGVLIPFNGFTIYDSIRVPGFFGNMEPKVENVEDEFGLTTTDPFGYLETVRSKLVEENKFYSKRIPYWVYRGLLQYGLLPGNVLVSDYNSNNANYFIDQVLQKLKGDVKPTYYNKGHFDKNLNFQNRMLKFEATFKQGIQSGIWTSSDI